MEQVGQALALRTLVLDQLGQGELPAPTAAMWPRFLSIRSQKKVIDRRVDLRTTPLYVRAGAIIPLDPVRQYTSQPVPGPTTLIVHPGTDGSFTLYDDDGHSTAWSTDADSNATWIRFIWNDAARRLTISRSEQMKHPLDQTRVYDVKLAGQDTAKRVKFDGAPQQLSL